MSTAAQREACRRATAARMRGNLNRAMRGKAQRVREDIAAYFVELGRRVHDRRLELDIPLDELAAAVGTTKTTLHELETAQNRKLGPSTGLVIRVAIALAMSPSELMP